MRQRASKLLQRGICAVCVLQLPSLTSAQERTAVAALEEIVVTARRREESILATPLSVAALSADYMRANGVYDIEKIGELVPSLTLATSDRANNTQIFIRGIGGGHPDPTFPFGSGMYIDGHYMPSSVDGFMSTLDIERVEVLRGPQGTLFGKNTTGGAINIVSAKPGPDYASGLTLRAGDFGRRDARGMLNVPLSEAVFARVSAARENYDGYYYNRTLDRGEGGTELSAFNGMLRIEPNEHWTIDTSLTASKKRDTGRGGQCAPGDEPFSRDRGTWYGDDAEQTQTYAECMTDIATSPYTNSGEKLSFSNVDREGAFVVARWDSAGELGALDNLSVSTNVSYRKSGYQYLHDQDLSPFAIQSRGNKGKRYTRTRSAEFLLEGAVNDRLDFVTGLHVFEDEIKSGDNRCYDLFNELFDPANPDADILCEPFIGGVQEDTPERELYTGDPAPVVVGNKHVWNSSYGLFGHLTYALNERWELEAGIRYTEDTREFSAFNALASNVALPDPRALATFDVILNEETVLGEGIITEGRKSYGEWTPLLSFKRTLDPGDRLDEGTIYFRYAEGYLTGSFNTEISIRQAPFLASVIAYGPERVNNYEVGFKGIFADGRLRLYSALFYMDYTDKQDNIVIDNRDRHFDTDDEEFDFTWNISEVDIYGIELELRTRPWPGGEMSFDLGYLINEYGDYRTLGDEFQQIDLSTLVINDLTPDWTFNWRVQHTFRLGNGATLTPMLGAYWQSGYDHREGLEKGDPPSPCFQDDYSKWRARLTFEPPSRSFELSLFGSNVTDEVIFETCRETRGVYQYRYAEPAAWGLEFTARWGA